jgi:phage replication O-like protein O
MANPQKENGHTQIANELFEVVLKADISKRQLRVFLSVLRKTYGWNKKFDAISSSQLSGMTGLNRSHCTRAINDLIEMQMIRVQPEPGVQGAKVVGPEKDYDRWLCSPFNPPSAGAKTAQVTKSPGAKTAPVEASPGAKTAPVAGAKTAHTKDKGKTIRRKTSREPAAPDIYLDFARWMWKLVSQRNKNPKPAPRAGWKQWREWVRAGVEDKGIPLEDLKAAFLWARQPTNTFRSESPRSLVEKFDKIERAMDEDRERKMQGRNGTLAQPVSPHDYIQLNDRARALQEKGEKNGRI